MSNNISNLLIEAMQLNQDSFVFEENNVDSIIKRKIKNESIIEREFDILLSLEFVPKEKLKPVYYKLLKYYKKINYDYAKEYEKMFIQKYKEETLLNTYDDLLALLESDDVYNEIKLHENELFSIIPELKKCKGFNQNSKWHIYDVYEHTLHVVASTHSNTILRLAALFHDIGKPLTYSEDISGQGHFYNHWNESINIFNKYKNNFFISEYDKDLIINLIYYHDINIDKMSDNEVNNMIQNIGEDNINLLFDLKRSDLLAQPPDYHYLLEDINRQEEKICGRTLKRI